MLPLGASVWNYIVIEQKARLDRQGIGRHGLRRVALLGLLGALLSHPGGALALSTPRVPAVLATEPDLFRQVAVFGADDRVLLPKRMAPLERSVGLIFEPRTRAVCTAFCVGADIIATASHCLFGTRGHRPPPLDGVTFRLGKSVLKQKGTRLRGASHRQADLHVLAGSANLNIRPPIDATRDWALARLEAPVCKGGELPFSARSPAALAIQGSERPVYQVGFHLDVGDWRLRLSPPCVVRRPSERIDGRTIAEDFSDAHQLLLHTCDTGGASSGSPLLVDGPRGPEVAGINVGTYLQSRVLTQAGEVVHRYRSDMVANTAVSATAFRPRLPDFARAEIVEKKSDLVRMQEVLSSLGLYDGRIDGLYGPAFRRAIEGFEKADRRPALGLATRQILSRLAVIEAGRAGTIVAGEANGDAPRGAIETGSVTKNR